VAGPGSAPVILVRWAAHRVHPPGSPLRCLRRASHRGRWWSL